MNVRNPKYNGLGTIDCEIEHPRYGWIPFTANPDDPEASGRELFAAIERGDFGKIAAAPPPVVIRPDPGIEARQTALTELKTRPPTDLLQRIELLERALGIRE
jgi:hypothetical protein